MTDSPKSLEVLGIIAGNRSLPLLVARQARTMGVRRIIAIGFEKETDPAIAGLVDQLVWLKVGQLSKMIAALKDNGVGKCVMAGQIAPSNLFEIRPDFRAVALLLKIKERNAHSLFTAIGSELKMDGIELISALPWLSPLMPARGFQSGPKLSRQQSDDVAYGLRIAKEIARLEIGQLVVVKNGALLAVEAFEGTDKCLARGGELAGKSGQAVAVKVAKENHDMRFDIPCIGPQTLQICADSGICVLALEGGKTLLLDQKEIEQLSRKHRITLTTI